MALGIPVVASDFPLYQEVVEGNDCGLCVDPLQPESIAEVIGRLVMNPEIARRMGENGRKAVMDKYNWSVEEKKLCAFYEHLLGAP
jgi:glycosyltransferase involved in cell wall biosynthesis